MMAVDKSAPRWALRTATAAAHDRLDHGMGAFDLGAAADYRAFLELSFRAVMRVETGLERSQIERHVPDWPFRSRRRALAADLEAFGSARTRALAPLEFATPAAALGAVYVLEGSRLGSQLLLKRAQGSTSPLVKGNTRYLSHGEVATLWPSFLRDLDTNITSSSLLADAKVGALATFAAFQEALDASVRTSPDPERQAV